MSSSQRRVVKNALAVPVAVGVTVAPILVDVEKTKINDKTGVSLLTPVCFCVYLERNIHISFVNTKGV